MNARASISSKPASVVSLLNFSGRNRLPLILQTEVAECGLACLAMVASYHGHETDLLSLRRRFSISSHGLSLKHLMSMASKLHLAPRALRAETADLSKITMPCVIHWGLNHFVVLKDITKKKYIIHDPAFGERHLDEIGFGKSFTGVVMELTPTQEFKELDERKRLQFSDFWTKAVGLKRSLTQIILLSFLLQIFALAAPFYMQTVVDNVLLRNDLSLLKVLAIGFTLLMLIQLGTSALREYVILHVSNKLGMQMSANLFRHLMRLPLDYFSKRHMGDIVSRFGSLSNVRNMLTNGMVAAVVDGVMAILVLTAMCFYDIKLTLIVLAIVFFYVLLRWFMYRPFRVLNEEVIVSSAKESSYFMESVRAIQTIKLFQKENERQHHWQNKLADVMNKNIRIARWGIGYATLNGLLFGIENILVVYIATTAVMGNTISLGMLYAFMAYKARFVSAMDSLVAQWIEFKMLDLHLNRLADIAYTKIENIDQHEIEDDQIFSAEKSLNGTKMNEKLLNSDFSNGILHWNLEQHETARATPTFGYFDEKFALLLEVNIPGLDDWNIQLVQYNLSLIKGEVYKISFWAKCDNFAPLCVVLGLAKEPWTIIESNSFAPNNEWQFFETFFVAKANDENARIVFNGFGKKSGNIYICDPSFCVHRGGESTNHNQSIYQPTDLNSNNFIKGKIEVRNLAYRYSEHEPYIFKNLNFIIHEKETVAITGPSGCGKTTLLKCMMGLIYPTEGEIFIDDKPLKNTPQYRSQISSVMQDDQLMSGDILENISCFSPVSDIEKVHRFAKLALIHYEIENMPMQYSTLVGDMGTSLSGGQKQRIILARALYREPRIIFMDEATSHLDVENEKLVNAHIQALSVTRIFVAHRPETIASAERIIRLERA